MWADLGVTVLQIRRLTATRAHTAQLTSKKSNYRGPALTIARTFGVADSDVCQGISVWLSSELLAPADGAR